MAAQNENALATTKDQQGKQQLGSLATASPARQLRVQAELPGLSPEDVRVEIGENEIVIQGERRVEHDENRRGVRRTEREYGVFYRTIPLPEGAQVDQAKASFRNGLLEVTVPIPQRASERRPVAIESGSQP